MQVDIHRVTGQRLTPISSLTRDDGVEFFVRDLVITGRLLGVEGDVLITLYGDSENSLMTDEERRDVECMAARAAHDDGVDLARLAAGG